MWGPQQIDSSSPQESKREDRSILLQKSICFEIESMAGNRQASKKWRQILGDQMACSPHCNILVASKLRDRDAGANFTRIVCWETHSKQEYHSILSQHTEIYSFLTVFHVKALNTVPPYSIH